MLRHMYYLAPTQLSPIWYSEKFSYDKKNDINAQKNSSCALCYREWKTETQTDNWFSITKKWQ